MNIFFKTSSDEELNKVLRKTHLKIVKRLFLKALQINSKTPQKNICNLLSETSNYISSHTHYKDEVQQLHLHLSNCLTCIYNNEDWAFDELRNFLNKHITN